MAESPSPSGPRMSEGSAAPLNAVPSSSFSPWAKAARLLVRWIERHERVDGLLDGLPKNTSKADRGRVQHLLFGALRHMGRLDAQVARWVPRQPRARLRAVLLLAGYELIEGRGDGHAARVVHHAVEQAKSLASPAEARLVNAVVRKLAASLPLQSSPPPGASAEDLAEFYSHPLWLVRRWLADFGADSTRALLHHNQQPAPLHARWRTPGDAAPAWLMPLEEPNFFDVIPGHWSEIESELSAGRLYLQDPSTRLAVDLLAPQPGETLLDLCAAPGGKTLQIADRLSAGRIVAWDLPGARIDRLKENLGRIRGVETVMIEGNLMDSAERILAARGLPQLFSGVLIDVPCSNTGVMRHRVDVRWRLQETDFRKHSLQQVTLLRAAAARVAPGGRLVYSTCSIDHEENEGVVQSFLEASKGDWSLEAQKISRPWETNHDGAAAFRLIRRAV
jgi:16S rRNA (cytosine967-C5)-methyltransferase